MARPADTAALDAACIVNGLIAGPCWLVSIVLACIACQHAHSTKSSHLFMLMPRPLDGEFSNGRLVNKLTKTQQDTHEKTNKLLARMSSVARESLWS